MKGIGITPTEDNLRSIFQNQYLATQPHVEIPTHVMTYGEAIATSINNGWRWSDAIDAKSPFVEQYEWAYNDSAYKHSAIQQEVRDGMPGLSAQEVVEKTNGIVREIEACKANDNA
ncbi:MAG: hypothetical protein ACK5WS_05945 [Alphaproteobacteria bacterium]|jgi:hypothetical protein|nr:hypothetical protein [Candidatus Jidaibacter sp.]